MRKIFIGAADLTMDERLSPEERDILKKMGHDSDEDIEAYLAQRAKNREKAMRESNAGEVLSTSIAPFPAQPDGSMNDRGYRGERMVTAGSRGSGELNEIERKLCREFGNSEGEYLAARAGKGASPAARYGLPPSPGELEAEHQKNGTMIDDARAQRLSAVQVAARAKDSTDEYLRNPNGADAWKAVAAALALGELAYEIINEKRAVNADHTDPHPYEAPASSEFARRHHGLTKDQVEILTRCNSKPMEFLAAKYWRESGSRSQNPLFLGAAEKGNGGNNAVTAAELIGRARSCLAQYIASYRDPDGWQNLGMALGYLSTWLARYAPAMGGGTDWQNVWY